MLSIKNLNVTIHHQQLYEVSELNFYDGSFHVISGCSGSGKTTLLYILGLLTNQYHFQYIYQAQPLRLDHPEETAAFREQHIGFLFQDTTLFNNFTVKENLDFYFQLGGKQYDQSTVDHLFTDLELDITIDAKIRQLSGGQRQRLALACITIKDPDLFILDEPTSALDTDTKQTILSFCLELAHKHHKTVIVASHDDAVMDLADVHYTIQNRQILCIKDTTSQFSQPPLIPKHINTKKIIRNYLKASFKHQTVLYTLMVCIGILGIGICLNYYIVDHNFATYEKQIIEKLHPNEVLITKTNIPKEGHWRDSEQGVPFFKDEFKALLEIPHLVSAYPFFYFTTAGDFAYRGMERPEKETIELYAIQGDSRQKITPNYYDILPIYDNSDIENLIVYKTQQEEGVYINSRLAMHIGYENLDQTTLYLPHCGIPVVYDISSGMYSTDDTTPIELMVGRVLYDETALNLPIKGVFNSDMSLPYSGNIASYTMYMDFDDMVSKQKEVMDDDEILQIQNANQIEDISTYQPWSSSSIYCFFDKGTQRQTLLKELQETLPSFTITKQYDRQLEEQQQLLTTAKQDRLTMVFIIGVIAIMISALTYMKNRLSIKNIALLKANGIDQHTITRLIILETALLAGIIFLASNLFSYLLVKKTNFHRFFIFPAITSTSVLLSILLTLITLTLPALLSTYHARKVYPDQILRDSHD